MICRFGYEKVYLPLCEVADTPFHIQWDELSHCFNAFIKKMVIVIYMIYATRNKKILQCIIICPPLNLKGTTSKSGKFTLSFKGNGIYGFASSTE